MENSKVSLDREGLIAFVKTHNVETPRPAHQTKTSELEAIVVANPNYVVKERSMKSRILELGLEGLSKKVIESQMREEGFEKIRYGYIFVVLKDNGIEVPKAKREKKVVVEVASQENSTSDIDTSEEGEFCNENVIIEEFA
jgi:hypothetical protein